MDLFSLLLQLHIIGATILSLLLMVTVGALYRSSAKTGIYKGLAVSLAATTVVEILTGSAMYVLASDSSLVAFCGKMAIYLSLTAVAEYALIHKMRTLVTTEA